MHRPWGRCHIYVFPVVRRPDDANPSSQNEAVNASELHVLVTDPLSHIIRVSAVLGERRTGWSVP